MHTELNEWFKCNTLLAKCEEIKFYGFSSA